MGDFEFGGKIIFIAGVAIVVCVVAMALSVLKAPWDFIFNR